MLLLLLRDLCLLWLASSSSLLSFRALLRSRQERVKGMARAQDLPLVGSSSSPLTFPGTDVSAIDCGRDPISSDLNHGRETGLIFLTP